MKTQLIRLRGKIGPGLALATLFVTTTLNAQTSPPPASQSAQESAAENLSPEDLNDLLGPIALYPDALVALILPASTVPSDITLAARYLKQNGDDANVDGQPWDESVKALARYPDVLTWMDDNLEWTNSLGEAFVEQPADVMNAVQGLRAEAKDKGNLVNTPQQTVVIEKQTQEIRIVPTEPDVIYVPQYDPEVVYVREYQPDYGPVLAFGAGFAVGAWLNYDCDWGGRSIYYGNDCGWNNRDRWNDRGYREGNGNVNVVNTTVNNTNINNITNNSNVNRWQASPTSRRQVTQRQRQNLGNARIARANAAVRHPNAKNVNGQPGKKAAIRPANVPKPTRLNASNKKHPNAAVRAPGAGNANAGKNNNGKNNGNGPGKAPGVNNKPNANKHPNAGNNPGGQKNHPKPTSSAPKVNGQSGGNSGGNGNKQPNKKPNSSDRKPGAGSGNGNADKPKNKPSSAPSNPGGSNQPKKPANNPDRPKQQSKPSSAPQNKPHVQQPKPQQQPKPHVQQPKPQQQRPQPRPQQPKPQKQPQVHQPQSKPKPQQSNQGGGQQQGNNKKKKKDKNN